MTHEQLLEECCGYTRKIRVLEDWFTFLMATNKFADPLRMEERLNLKRPLDMPSIGELGTLRKTSLVIWADKLSTWAWKIEDIKDACFTENLLSGKFRFAVHAVLCNLESDELKDWQTPFTYDMENLPGVFPKKLKAPKAEPVLCNSNPDNAS